MYCFPTTKILTVSVVPPDMVSVHLCVLCPPRQYHKIQLQVWSLQRIDHLPKEVIRICLAEGALVNELQAGWY
jgi:hypothetical protein